jgi:hypothetical protein
VALLPSMDSDDLGLLERLAKSKDFFVAEAVGNEIARRPRLELTKVAEICRKYKHSQAAKAGLRAVEAIKSLERA